MEALFGGYPVDIEVRGDDAILTCKGVTGKLSQLEAYMQKKNYPSNYYPFGDNCHIEEEGKFIRIACLKESRSMINRLVSQLRLEMNKQSII
jgi:hypothetical protein